jgi:signal transduction histidine kinase
MWFIALPVVVGAGVESIEIGAWRIDQMSEALFICVVGILILVPCFAIVVGMARAHGHVAYALLGPSRTEMLEHRVGTLTRSRAEVMDAMLIERRRIERDLHDGVQQQLVSLAMNLGMAKEKLAADATSSDPAGAAAARDLVETSHDEVKLVLKELRELVQGIYPAVLSDRGLDAALSAAAGRCPVPVTLTTRLDRRLAEAAEATAYFVVTEALTNVAKHSGATQAWLDVGLEGELLAIEVRDDGRGMPDRTESRGLDGLYDRVAALDGQLIVQSPQTGGTIVRALIPCGS